MSKRNLSEGQKILMGKGLYQKWPKVLAGKCKGLPENSVHRDRKKVEARRNAAIKNNQRRKAEKAEQARAQEARATAAKRVHEAAKKREEVVDFSAMKISDLKDLARAAKISGFSKANKATLVGMLNEHMGYAG